MSQNQTSPTQNEKTIQAVETASKSIVGALLDLGSAWAAHGLNAGKYSLENGARALEKTAKAFETMAKEIEKKNNNKPDAA
jgi:hypothetical protein